MPHAIIIRESINIIIKGLCLYKGKHSEEVRTRYGSSGNGRHECTEEEEEDGDVITGNMQWKDPIIRKNG